MRFDDFTILNDCRARWIVTVEGEEYTAMLGIFSGDVQKTRSIPGFRRGRAPLDVVVAAYGDTFYQDASVALLPAIYNESVTRQDLAPVADPEIRLIQCDRERLCAMMSVDIYPKVTIEGYKGIRAVRPAESVSEAEMDAEIRRFRENHLEVIPASRQSGEDDLIYFTVTAEADGKPIENVFPLPFLQRFDQPEVLPGLKEQLRGRAVGDTLRYETTLPAEMIGPEYAKTPVTLQIRVSEIKTRSLKPVDDSLFRPAYASRADFLEKRRAELEKIKKLHADEVFEKNVRAALGALVTANLPRSMVEAETGKLLVNLSSGLRSQGGITGFLKENGMSAEEVRAQVEKLALDNLKFMLAIDAVAAAEGILDENDAVREKKAFAVVMENAIPVAEEEQ